MESLISYIDTNNFSGVTQGLEAHPEWLDQADNNGRALLHHAAWGGRDEMVAFLLERGSQVILTPDNNRSCPIHFAAQSGSIPTVDRIVNWIRTQHGPEMVNQQLETAGYDHLIPLDFAVRSLNGDLMVMMFQLRPETFWISRSARCGSKLDPRVYSMVIDTFGPDQFREWIIRHDYTPITGIYLYAPDIEIEKIIPLGKISSVLRCDLLRQICRSGTSDTIHRCIRHLQPVNKLELYRILGISDIRGISRKAFEILFVESNQFMDRDPEELSALMYISILRDVESIFISIYSLGFNRYGWSWVVDSMLGYLNSDIPNGMAAFLWSQPNSSLHLRLENICLKMVEDPFTRGRMWKFMNLRDLISRQRSVVTMINAVWLVNIVGGQGLGWKILQIPDLIGNPPIHTAITTNQMEMTKFLIQMGCELVDLRPWLKLVNASMMREFIFALMGEDSISESDRLQIRFSVYFEISLVWRLLYAV